MNVRAQAIGMASQTQVELHLRVLFRELTCGTQNVANSIFQQFFPIFLQNCGFYAFYFFSVRSNPPLRATMADREKGINFVLAVFVWLL